MEGTAMRNSVLNGMGALFIAICTFSIFGLAMDQALAQTPAAAQAKSPSPEVVGMLTKELIVTPICAA